MDRYCCHVKGNLHNCVGNRRISSVPDGRSVGDLESWRYKPSFHFYRCMNSIFERWNIYNRLYSLKDNTWVLTGQYPRYWPPNGFLPRSPKQGESGKSEKVFATWQHPIGWYWVVSMAWVLTGQYPSIFHLEGHIVGNLNKRNHYTFLVGMTENFHFQVWNSKKVSLLFFLHLCPLGNMKFQKYP